MRNSGLEPRGTAFFVGVPIEGIDGKVATYAVTARHVIDGIKERATDGQSYFRFNQRGGSAAHVSLPITEWRFLDDPSVDVAVAPVKMDFARFDHRVLPHALFLTVERIEKHAIGPGDELFFPGLFVHHQGKETSIPILRVGNIAAMPGERISTKRHGDIRAYLVEARSIGGLSGSPVFIHIGPGRVLKGNYTLGGLTFFLLGLVHGHYDIVDVLDAADDPPLQDATTGLSINTGIAIAIPADDIDRLLSHPDFVEQRNQAREHFLGRSEQGKPDS